MIAAKKSIFSTTFRWGGKDSRSAADICPSLTSLEEKYPLVELIMKLFMIRFWFFDKRLLDIAKGLLCKAEKISARYFFVA